MSIDLTRDVALKDFFKKNERFASIVNAVLFHGKKVIFPHNVHELDSVESMVTDKTITTHKQAVRERDVIKLVWIDDGYVIIAIENQHVSQKEMAARCGNYDMLRYLKQLENYGKVYGVVTIVLFTGEYRWTNPKSIYESIEVIPEKMKDYIQDWNAHIVDMKDINAAEVDEEETRMLVEGIQMVYEIKKNSTRLMENLGMTQEVALYVAVVTGFSELLEKVKESKEGEMIHMCDALDALREGYKQEYLLQGIKQGVKQGIEQGIKQGAQQERETLQKKNVQTMLNNGVSVELIAKYLSLTEAQVNDYANLLVV